MAKAPRGNNAETGDAAENNDAPTQIDGEQPLDGMEALAPIEDESEEDKAKRPQVPKELRPLFNEVARLSGMLSMARRSIYDGKPDKAVKALGMLERAVPDAREMAELSVS